MDFSNWFTETEQQMALPDARQFAYIGCVLEKISQTHLIGLARRLFMEQNGREIPLGWTIRAHHMTVKFKPQPPDMEALHAFFGQKIELHAVGFFSDENGAAMTVSSTPALPISNGVPHITIAHSKSVGPVYSNNLIQNKSRMIAAHDNVPLISILLGVQHDQSKVWPQTVIPLASPSLV